MTTIIQGIEQTINRTVSLGCFAFTTYNTVELIRVRHNAYRESLTELDHVVFLLGLSDVISTKSELRLKELIQNGLETLSDKARERISEIQ